MTAQISASRCVVDRCRQGRSACPAPETCSYIVGRQAQAAEAATEVGADDDKGPMEGAWLVTNSALGLAAWGVVLLVPLAVYWLI